LTSTPYHLLYLPSYLFRVLQFLTLLLHPFPLLSIMSNTATPNVVTKQSLTAATTTTDKQKDMQSSTLQYDSANLMTSNFGVRIGDDDSSLKAGTRGPSLLEDFHFREKMTHFDHERIPERVVHARGSGAHGFFQVYDNSLSKYTTAKVLTDPSRITSTFVRFSTVMGSKGSADTVRDVRGFATKFYTQEGNWDLVGNNIPVFFVQDALKFPDIIHAGKPEPHNEIPQAQTAHDNWWSVTSPHTTPDCHLTTYPTVSTTSSRSFPSASHVGTSSRSPPSRLT
jgi:catalase